MLYILLWPIQNSFWENLFYLLPWAVVRSWKFTIESFVKLFQSNFDSHYIKSLSVFGVAFIVSLVFSILMPRLIQKRAS